MRNPQTFHPLLLMVFYAFLFDIFIFLFVGLIYLFSGWQTIQQYGNGLLWAGAVGIVLLLLGAGWRNGRREEQAALSQVMREHEVFFLLNRENDARARFMLGGLIALVIVFAIGLILH